MKGSVSWICLGTVLALGLAACEGDGGGADAIADAAGPDPADVVQDVPADPGAPDTPADPGAPDPGDSPDTVEPEDPGAAADTTSEDAPCLDAGEDVEKPASRACIGCHTNQAILEELAPEDEEPAGGGG